MENPAQFCVENNMLWTSEGSFSVMGVLSQKGDEYTPSLCPLQMPLAWPRTAILAEGPSQRPNARKPSEMILAAS